jgi:hypothetical protein
MNAPDAEHTLRNQLAIILGYAELVSAKDEKDDSR